MYGKTLSDFPGRFETFREALKGLSRMDLDAAFIRAIRTLEEFPVPAQIIQFAHDESVNRRYEEDQRRIAAQRVEDDVRKNDRFIPEWIPPRSSTPEEIHAREAAEDAAREERGREFQEMLKEAAQRRSMNPALPVDYPGRRRERGNA